MPTPAPPAFWRSPRLTFPFPEEEYEIPAPPQKPRPPGPAMLALLSSGTMLVVMVALGLATGMISRFIYFLPMMLASGIAAVFANRYQKRQYEKEMQEREAEYQDLLDYHRQELQERQDHQLKILRLKDPAPKECALWVEKRHRNLWVRHPEDEDFLEVRLGIGDRPSSIVVKPPALDHPTRPDPLITEAREIAEEFATLPQAPISLPIASGDVLGIAGESRDRVQNLVFSIILQTALHHAPHEVKIAIVYPKEEREEWSWVRWLPHVWDDEHHRRFLAEDSQNAHRLLMQFNDALNHRAHKIQQHVGNTTSIPLPRYLFILASPKLVREEPVLFRLQTEGPSLGVYPLFLASQHRNLPEYCNTFVRFASGKGEEATLVITQPDGQFVQYDFKPDRVSTRLLQQLALQMAPLRLHYLSEDDIPSNVPLLNLFTQNGKPVTRTEDLVLPWGNEQERWKKVEAKSLAVPIGRRIGNELLYLDLHEAEHGPNGLVAGMVGAGKSVLLQTLVTSLAVHFHPDQVSFLQVADNA